MPRRPPAAVLVLSALLVSPAAPTHSTDQVAADPRPEPDTSRPSRPEGDDGRGPERVEARRTGPDPEVVSALRRWLVVYRGATTPVLERWGELATMLTQRPAAALEEPCLRFRHALLALEWTAILPVPEPAADRALRQTLHHLEGAGRACSEHRPFALEGRLHEAAAAHRRFAERLRLHGLEP